MGEKEKAVKEEPDSSSEDGLWERGIEHAFKEASLRRGETRLETIERVTGASSCLRLFPRKVEEPEIRRVPGLERQAIEGGDPRYALLSELSRSDRSTVLEALDRDLGRPVALKVLPEERTCDEAAVCRFVEQAQIAGQLQHPGIVPVYGLGAGADGRPFFVMKLIAGETLADLLEGGSSAPAHDLLSVFEQVSLAMAYAHSRGVLHGDLTPANVVVGRFGEVLVIDWDRAVVGGDPRIDVAALGRLLEAILTASGDGDENLAAVARACAKPDPEKGPADAGDAAIAVHGRLAAREEEAHRAEVDAVREKARASAERARAVTQRRQVEREQHARIRTLAAAAVLLLVLVVGGALALWRTGEDRAALERAEAGVAEAMGEAARREGAGDLASAWIWARKAAVLAGAGGADEATVRGAEDLLARLARRESLLREDAALLDRLEQIQILALMGIQGPANLDQRYREAFLECGIDVEAMSVEAAAEAVLSRTCSQELVAAIDDWVLLQRSRKDLTATDWEGLLSIARASDPDEWRNRLRDGILELDVENIRTLAATADTGLLPGQTIHLLAVLLEEVGEFEVAVDVVRQGLHNHPQDASLFEMLARCLKRLEPPRHAEAVTCYYEALAILPDSPLLWNSLGIVLGDLGEMEDAVTAFRRTLELFPRFASAMTNIGVVRFKQGKLAQAIVAYREARDMDPGNAICHMNLGAALNAAGEREEALEAHRKAYELKPDGLWVNFNLGLQYLGMGDPAGAIPYLRRATELAPRHIPSRVMLSVVLSRAGYHEAAVAVLEETLEFKPAAVGALHNLALILCSCPDERLHDYERAVEYAAWAWR